MTTPHPHLQITLLTAQHAPAYKTLRDEALRCAPEAFTSDYASAVLQPAASYVPRLSTPTSEGFFLGAFDASGRLVGSIGCQREARLQQRHLASVVAMMVAPQVQRQGVGRQLLRACVAQAEQIDGLAQLILTVTASNTHTVRLYESLGFTPYGLLPQAIMVAGVGYDKLHMVRRLDAAPLPPTHAHP